METIFRNGAVTVKNSPAFTPRSIDINTHLCGREVESSASFWTARDKNHKDGERAAYVSVSVKGNELSHETPRDESEREYFTPRATEQVTYLEIEDARALRDALSAALACADLK